MKAAYLYCSVVHFPGICKTSICATPVRRLKNDALLHRAQNTLCRRDACSGREGLNLAGVSPVVPIARFRHVVIPQFVVGNHTFMAWCKRPGCPEDFAPLR